MKKEKGQKVKFIVYVVVRVLVVLALIRQIWEHDWHDVMLCGMTLILLFLPTLLSKQLALRLPNVLEIIIVVFIFAAEILGEVHGFYVIFPNWDDILHTTNGFLAAAIGIALVDVLNQHENVKLNLSPAFVAVVSFCFSMTIGVLWEFFECSMDMFCGTDMQKDTWISAFNSVAINPDGVNVPVHVDVDMEGLLEKVSAQNFVPVIDDEKVFIGKTYLLNDFAADERTFESCSRNFCR